MAQYLLRRTIILIVSLLVAMVIIFLLLRALPGDPANALLSINATPEQVAAARAQVGADLPVYEQMVRWFGSMLTLDLGSSFVSTLPSALSSCLSRGVNALSLSRRGVFPTGAVDTLT